MGAAARKALEWFGFAHRSTPAAKVHTPLPRDRAKADGGHRPTGLFATLTDAQKRAALNYRGPENFGDKALPSQG
jgi:hypothetical protein